jgi:hypothetical protein
MAGQGPRRHHPHIAIAAELENQGEHHLQIAKIAVNLGICIK